MSPVMEFFDEEYLHLMQSVFRRDIIIVVIYVVICLSLVTGLWHALTIFKKRISWGQARRMGVTRSYYFALTILFYAVLFDATYAFGGLFYATPIWLDLLSPLLIMGAIGIIYARLQRRSRFNRNKFALLVMLPLGISGCHIVNQVGQDTSVELGRRAGISMLLNSGNSLDGLALRNVDNLAEAIPIVRHLSIQTDTIVGKIAFKNTLEKGLFGDAMTAKRITSMGYSKLPSKYNSINGIDGVFVKRDKFGGIEQLLIVESKVDGGRLFLNQMSDEWVLDRVSRMAQSSVPQVRRTGDLVMSIFSESPQLIRKELWTHQLSTGTTTVRGVDKVGEVGGLLMQWSDNFIHNQLIVWCQHRPIQCVE